jgi:tRNA 5-methylaminomethyl-2-thiouridine biosynthesis bifunctional protein
VIDVAIVGSGINGALSAYLLEKNNLKVTVFEKDKIAGGGSGAAGAFLSPKFVKTSKLKNLINNSLDIALKFYDENFTECINRYNLLHIAKDEKDAKNLKYVKSHNEFELLNNPPFIPNNEYIYISKSAIVDAKKLIYELLKNVTFINQNITTIRKKDDYWVLNDKYKAKKVILSTGAYKNDFLNEEYMKKAIRGIWGHRIDIKTTTKNDISIHQFVSISPNKNGVISIGATHNVHYHPQTSKETYCMQSAQEELLQKASRTIPLENVQIIKDYMGLRSGSSDYLPIIGEFVDSKKTFEALSRRELEFKKQDFSKYIYHKGLYTINASAGYGFVLAPYLADTLVKNILYDKEIDTSLQVARFFARYARRSF